MRGRTIILDVDGTLCPDGESMVSREIAETINQLKVNNFVYLVSNKKLPGRLPKMAEHLGVNFLESKYRKPSKLMLKGLPESQQKDVVVIGDKFMTDGLLAKRAGAFFIKVLSLRGSRETWLVRFSYWLDGLAAKLFYHQP